MERTATTVRRRRRFAAFGLLLGLAVLGLLRSDATARTTFVLNDARGARFPLPDLVVPVAATVRGLALAILVLAVV